MLKLSSRLVVCVVLLASAPAGAEPFAYVVGALATDSPSTIVQRDTLFRVDLETAEAVVIGRVEDASSPGTFYTSVKGLAILDGVLYGVDEQTNCLITIDAETGQATLVGAFTDFLTGQPLPSMQKFGLSSDLWFSSRFGIRIIGILDPTDARLLVIASGGAQAPDTEAIADLRPGSGRLWGLRFLGSGDYDLITILKVPPFEGLPLNFVTSQGVISPQIGLTDLGLDTAPGGALWGIGRDSVGPAELFQVDTETVTVSGFTDITVPATGQVVVNAYSLVIIPPDSVPALPIGMLAVLAISVLTLGAWRLRQAPSETTLG